MLSRSKNNKNPQADQRDWGSATLTASAERKVESSRNCETFLDAPEGGRYLVLPMAFNQFNKGVSPAYSVLFHSTATSTLFRTISQYIDTSKYIVSRLYALYSHRTSVHTPNSRTARSHSHAV